LREDASNRDALLGLAALDTRAGRFEAADAAYVRLLQIDPRDPHAQAGLLALRAARVDPLAAESRVKTLLASDPNAHVLNFALGNQLARQERWAEAQQQYFKAFAGDPENADFAYNLAVSLDHLRQPKIALDYYQRSLELSRKVKDDRRTAATLNNIGALYLELGEPQKAIQTQMEALPLRRTSGDADGEANSLYNLGRAYARSGERTTALAGANGGAALRVADALYSYGEYGQAAELYRAALQKGGQDANLVNTRLGAALALGGQRAEAETAFRAVTGPRAELAQLWLLWLSSHHA